MERRTSLSHIVTIQTEVRDATAVRSACRRLHLTEPAHRTVDLYSGRATGLAVELPDWQYPAVCDTTTGRVHFDNYGGRWGEQKELDRFLQAYAVERASAEARRRGRTVTEQPLEDGSIKLTVYAGGAA